MPLAPPEIPVGLPGDLLLRRPDLRRARAQMVAAAARVGQARADLFPKIVLTGAAGRQATGIQQFTLGAGNFFSLGPQLSLPVFNAGRIRANIETQKQRLNESSLAYQNAILNVLREVETSLTSYQHEQERREELVIAEDASKRATQMANELYVRGLADFLSVLDAQRQQLQAEDALAESDTTVLTDLVAIYKSLGGGWQ
ncbi:MAG: TolC family protein [Acidobacteriaceae bacterium]|nr:TolC family protein [Acidobacteriaceae bacterium]